MVGVTNVVTSELKTLSISLNGVSKISYNGSQALSLNITAASVGAASASHTHTPAQIGLGNVNNTSDNDKLVKGLKGSYSGSGGKQPPSFVKGTEVKALMSNEIGEYVDWIYMDTYGGPDVPYVSAIGVEKTKYATPWIMSATKGSNEWTIKRKIATLPSGLFSSGHFIITDGTYGRLTASDYHPNSFAPKTHSHTAAQVGAAASNHTHNYAASNHSHTPSSIGAATSGHEHYYLRTNITDTRDSATSPNTYNNVFKCVGIKRLSPMGLSGKASGTYLNVMGSRGWNESSGGDSMEFAFANGGEMWLRTGLTTSWHPWVLVAAHNSKAMICQTNSPNASGMWAW